MQTVSRSNFTTVTTEGAILPADLLQRIVDGRNLEGLQPTDYHLAPNERLNEAINRSWNRLLGVWDSFDERRQQLPDHDRGTTLTRESWLLILLDELGFGRPTFVRSLPITDDASRLTEEDTPTYPISHEWQYVPLHLIAFRQSLDRVDQDRGERYRRSPHSLLQEFLNRSEAHLWGVVSNGLRLRILRDNVNFTRAAYLEFDLEAMMDGEIYSDFTLLWLVAHQSRFEGEPETSWLENWSQEAAEQGTRALDSLRDGVQNAISELGRGFLAHPANKDLRAQLQGGDDLGQGLDKQDYYRQLLRLVYRLIFLFVAEERNLLLVAGADPAIRERYYDHYSATHLRELAARRRSGPHPDLYRTLRLVMKLLRDGYPPLGLPGLGSFLFSGRSTPHLDEAEIANEALLKAVRALTFTVQDGVRRPVDYKNLGAEELGSVYESLLELHPEMNVGAATFRLKFAAGSERKTTGSYYTPTSLINSLLDTALDPVVADRLRGKRGQEAEEALLDIKVVDPAAGSGHFLIAAANRLARHLARIRTGDEEPSPEANRLALRDVVRHCIHGVDVNEMAVELCKVGLWLETLDPGKPLSFLERNIQCGNSLIGATPELLEEGIPDDAFKTITGDERDYVKEFRSVNHEQRKGKGSLFKGQTMQPWDRLGNLAAAMQQLDEMADDTVSGVRAQEEAYAEMVRSSDYQYGKLWADAWCAAFVWPKIGEDKGGYPYPITEEEFRRIEYSPHAVPPWMKEEIQALEEEYQFFHWHLAFPHVFTHDESRLTDDASSDAEGATRNDGFDVVLGNPPWERVKLQEKEWFATRSPKIAEARNKAARTKLIKKLREDDPDLHAAFMQAKRKAEGESHFARNSGRYPLAGRGDINTYPLFAELVRQVQSPTGRVGIIVPTGIATDYYTQYYFQDLVDTAALVSLFDFENREGIFPEVHRSYKFCLLTLTGPDRPADAAEFLFFAQEAADLRDEEKRFTLTPADIARINPNTRTVPIFRSRRDAELTKAIYRRAPVLIEEGPPERNPWGITLSTMFHMSGDSDLFRTREELEAEGWQLHGNRFVRGDDVYLPLYEAKMIHHFDHRWATYEGMDTRDVTVPEKQDPTCVVLPRYWVPARQVGERLGSMPFRWLTIFRNVARSTDERTAIISTIPFVGVGHSAPLVISESKGVNAQIGLFSSLLSTFVVDYITRQKLGGINFTFSYFKQIAAVRPSAFGEICEWFPGTSVAEWLSPIILELSYTAYDLQSFAQDLGYRGPPFRWDEERRFLLRCELDAAYFHLYGIARDDVTYIMDTFPIVRRKDEDQYSEYRTKRVILQIYEEMAEAIETGEPYQTRLDPPPAHPDAAHPWDEEYLGPKLPVEEWWDRDDVQAASESERVAYSQPGDGDAKAVKEPGPALELRSPEPPKPKEKPEAPRSAQPSLITEFNPPEGSRSQRLKRVMALGDQVKGNRQDTAAIAELIAALADEDESIRWLAGSALGLLGGSLVVQTLAAYLEQEPAEEARQEAIKALHRIADNPREDEAVREKAEQLAY